jgi:CBS domain-containing protein
LNPHHFLFRFCQFMTHDVITVEPDTEISVAVGRMLSKRVNCLSVVDDENNL